MRPHLDSSAPAPEGPHRPGVPLDGLVVPGLLLLVARDVLLHDPHRVLAWRLAHEPALAAAVPGWLGPLLPRASGAFDRDPVALLLGATAVGLAGLYLVAALARARAAWRAALLGAAALSLVVLPTLALVVMGFATGRPYGQDGGVVQLPLALDRLLAGQSPYGADYSASMLGRQARVSEFWAAYGGNPILRHHAYLPGTHLVMMPFYLALRPVLGGFDPRLVTLLAYAAATLLASRVVEGSPRRLAAAAVVAVNPLVYWPQTFGANDLVMGALLLGAAWLARAGRPIAAAAALGLACSTKPLAWPFAPFLLVHLASLRGFDDLLSRAGLRRLAGPVLTSAAVFAAVVGPVAALDPRAFWGDVVAYNAGLAGVDAYPLGGTPGIGVANFLIYAGRVASLREHVSFGPLYLLLVPAGLLLLRWTMREGRLCAALLSGSAALLLSVYVSRVAHPNYLMLTAVLVPVALLMDEVRTADVALVPLLLLSLAVEVAEHELFRGIWEQAVRSGTAGSLGFLRPRAGPGLTSDPLGLALSAALGGLAALYLAAGTLGAGARLRRGLTVAGVLLAVFVPAGLVITLGGDGGALRGQDPWLAEVARDGTADPSNPRTEVVEAWSLSFKRDPPAAVEPSSTSSGAWLVARLTRAARSHDPRVLLFAAAAVLLVAAGARLPRDRVDVAWAGLLLTPAAALGLVFGSPSVLVCGGILAAEFLAARRRELTAGAVAGLATAIVPSTLFAAPFALLPAARPRVGRLVSGLVVGFMALAGPGILIDPSHLGRVLTPAERVQPGVGLANLFVYFGAEASSTARASAALLPLAVVALATAWAWRRRGRYEPIAAAAAGLVAGAFVVSGCAADALAVPLALIALHAVRTRVDVGTLDGLAATRGPSSTGAVST